MAPYLRRHIKNGCLAFITFITLTAFTVTSALITKNKQKNKDHQEENQEEIKFDRINQEDWYKLWQNLITFRSFPVNTPGSNNVNTGIGTNVLNSFFFFQHNIAYGNSALQSVATENHNVAVGNYALNAATSGANTAFGSYALSNTTSGTANTALGFFAGRGNKSGNRNIALGNETLHYATTASDNISLCF